MIETLSKISKKIYWIQPIIMLVGVGSLSLFVITVLKSGTTENDGYLIPSVLGFIWTLLYLLLVSAFPYVPEKPDPSIKFFKRIKIKFKRGIYYLIGIVFVVTTLAGIVLSFRMINIWLTDY